MRKMPIILFLIGIPILLIAIVFGYSRFISTTKTYAEPDSQKVHVVATIYPLGDFARNIGGEYVHVTVATPTGVEPHDFEPTPRQVAFMSQADVFVMNGGGVDAWAENIASQVRQRGGKVVDLEEVIGFYTAEEVDPHVWLDPQLAQDAVRHIRYAIIEVDQAHKDEYLTLTDLYLTKLLGLHEAYASGLARCELRDILVSHDAFGYIGRRYTVHIHSLLGMSPEEEPSARELAELSNTARDLGVKTVFFETLVSPKVARTLAREIGAETAVLNPIEGLTAAQEIKGENYVSIMEANLEALRKAMLCQ